MKYIHIDSERKINFDEVEELIIVSDYLLDQLPTLEKIHHTVLPSSINTREEYFEACDYSYSLSDRIIQSIVVWLKKNYGISFSIEECRYVFSDYLIMLIFELYTQYVKFESINLSGWQFSVTNQNIIPFTLDDGTRKSREFHSYLLGMICESKGAINIGKRLNSEPNYASNANHFILKSFKKLVKTLFERKIRMRIRLTSIYGFLLMFSRFPRKIKANSIIMRTFLSKRVDKDIARKSEGKIVCLEEAHFSYIEKKSIKKKHVDKASRYKMLEQFIPNNDFEKLLIKIIVDTMPLSFCENVKERYNKTNIFAKNYDVKKIYSAKYHDGVFAAIMKRNGSKIIEIQHGGGYASFYGAGSPEYPVYDEFLTWGWEDEQLPCNTRAICGNRFTREKRVPLNKEIQRILLISVDTLEWETIIDYRDNKYIEKHFTFIDNLSKELQNKLVVRFRYDILGLSKIYEKKYPHIKIEWAREISQEKSVNISDVVIVDSFSSSFYEAYQSGRPTYTYGAMTPVSMTNCLKTRLKIFEQYGLYKESGKEMAEYLNKNLYTEYKAWLNGEYNDIVEDFLIYFMRIDKNAREEWEKEFLS